MYYTFDNFIPVESVFALIANLSRLKQQYIKESNNNVINEITTEMTAIAIAAVLIKLLLVAVCVV